MVEEMMLLANCTVAEAALRAFPACALLRRHPTPPPRQFEPLLRAAAAVGVSIDVSSSKVRGGGGGVGGGRVGVGCGCGCCRGRCRCRRCCCREVAARRPDCQTKSCWSVDGVSALCRCCRSASPLAVRQPWPPAQWPHALPCPNPTPFPSPLACVSHGPPAQWPLPVGCVSAMPPSPATPRRGSCLLAVPHPACWRCPILPAGCAPILPAGCAPALRPHGAATCLRAVPPSFLSCRRWLSRWTGL